MKYVLQDTIDGYRISLQSDDGSAVHSIHEKGGHGPVEQLYADAARTYTELRSQEVRARRMGDI